MTSDEDHGDPLRERVEVFISKWHSGWSTRAQADALADDLAGFLVACVRAGELSERMRCADILRSHPADLGTALSLVEMGSPEPGNLGTE